MKAATAKLRMLESDTIGGFVSKTLGRVKSAAAAIEQAPSAAFVPVDKAIGVLVSVESDLVSRVKFLKTELEKCEMKT